MERKFDPSNLAAILDRNAGGDLDLIWECRSGAFERETGITRARFEEYATGAAVPTVDELVKIAGWFKVPMDFVAGRCSRETAENILKHYAMYMGEMMPRANFQQRAAMIDVAWAENPSDFPYNLMVAVNNGEPIDYLATDDVWAGVDDALGTLKERDREILLKRFRDKKSVAEIADEYGLTRSRVDQIVKESLRQLRRPNAFLCLMFGHDYASRKNELTERRARLEKEAELLERWSQELATKREQLEEMDAELAVSGGEPLTGAQRCEFRRVAIYELGLSTRARCALLRAGANNLEEAISVLRSGEMSKTGGCGKRTLTEILDVVESRTGLSFHEVYKV